MNILGIRELTIDGIMINNKLENITYGGGGTSHNVIWNLKDTKNNLFIGGICGESNIANKEIEILNDYNINTDFLSLRRKKTRKVFTIIDETKDTKNSINCPKCNKDTWSSSAKYKFDKETLEKYKIDIIVFDAYKNENNDIAFYTKEKNILNVLDWGTIGNLRYFSQDKMKELSKNPYDVIQVNSRVSNFFKKRLELETNRELFEFLNVNFLILTDGENGTTIINKENEETIVFEVDKVIDNNGAGDATLASFIDALIKTNYNKNRNFDDLINVFSEISKRKVTNVLKVYGSRINYPYFKKETSDINECSLCFERFEDNKKEKKKRIKFKIETAVDQIKSRVTNGLNNNNIDKTRKFINKLNENDRILLLGQGASFVAASYIAKIINNNTKAIAQTMYLNEIYENRFVNKFNYIFLISNSGTSPDVKKASEFLKENNKTIFLLTAKESYDDSDTNTISYYSDKWTRERGFLSIEGILLPVLIFILATESTISIDNIINKIEEVRVKSEEKFKEDFVNLDIKDNINIDLFYDNDSYEIALDIESKLVESSFARVVFHEKKNFSHGRFSILKGSPSDLVIYLNYVDDRYEKKLIKYIDDKNIPVLYLANNYNSNERYDLLYNIMELQYFIKELSIFIDRDLSDPEYDKLDAKLYKHK